MGCGFTLKSRSDESDPMNYTRKRRRLHHPLDDMLNHVAENISDDAEDHRTCFDYIYDHLIEWAEEREPDDIAISQIRREAQKYFQEYMARYEE